MPGSKTTPRTRSTVPAGPSERRRHARFPAVGSATLRWLGFSGEFCETRGLVRNVAAQGIAVLLHEPVAVGQIVQVRLHETDFKASVRTCRSKGEGFLAGLQVVADEAQYEQCRRRWAWLFSRTFRA